jgi:beta-lactamase regulating signal transducer with metallopeptidase domain
MTAAWLESAARSWWDWALSVSWQAAVLVAALLVLGRLAGGRIWPHVQLVAWALVLARLVLPADLSSPVSILGAIRGSADPAAAAGLPRAAGVAAGPGFWPAVAAAVWVFGAASIAAVLLAREVRMRRALRTSASAPPAPARAALRAAAERLGLRRLPALVVSAHVRSPAVFGVLRPVVVLPGGAACAIPASDLELALLHELAHVCRHDLLVRAAARAIQVVWWFHPAAWIAARRVAALQEIACDLTVAGRLRDAAADYREALVRAAGRLLLPLEDSAKLGLALLGSASEIVRRIQWLDRRGLPSARARRALCACVAAFMIGCVLPMSGAAAATPPVPLPSAGDEERELEAARQVLASALAGNRESCFRIQFAAARLAAASERPPSRNGVIP